MTDIRMSRRQFIALPVAAACLTLPALPTFAQSYPTRPIKIVVPSPLAAQQTFLRAQSETVCRGHGDNLLSSRTSPARAFG